MLKEDAAKPADLGKATHTDDIVVRAQATIQQLHAVRTALGKVVYGQQHTVDLALAALLAGGHALIVGVPGLAKTLLVETLAHTLGLTTKRIQFTPDLIPADILGAEILDQNSRGERVFRFVEGPIFTQLLMADEINRASPRTQSALLQAMQEQHVTISGKRHEIPKPFHVLATQNPLEHDGTYPLPEAQLDRFLMQIDIDYPDRETEKRILEATTDLEQARPTAVMQAEDLMSCQKLVRLMPIGESVADAILDLVRSLRVDAAQPWTPCINWGPGPRAVQALALTVRAQALIDGRFAPALEDVAALATGVLKHRMDLTYSARADGHTTTGVIKAALTALDLAG